jgi:hypothetical protein
MGGWGRTWGLAVVLALVLLGGYEWFWRARGFVPQLTDDAKLWASARASIKSRDPFQIVLLGDSRMQLAVDPELFAQTAHTQIPVDLAIDGASFLPVLRDLANAPEFCGTAICGLSPSIVADPNSGTPIDYVNGFHRRGPSDRVEQMLRERVERHLVLRLPALQPLWVWRQGMQGRLPEPDYVQLLPTRYRRADYRKTNVAEMAQRRLDAFRRAKPVPQSVLDARIADLREIVGSIQSHGGKVIFVILPSSGGVREIEDQLLPRATFYDRIAEQTGAAAIHFADVPELAHFTCPDGAHLDYRDARDFTRELATILQPLLRSGSGTRD